MALISYLTFSVEIFRFDSCSFWSCSSSIDSSPPFLKYRSMFFKYSSFSDDLDKLILCFIIYNDCFSKCSFKHVIKQHSKSFSSPLHSFHCFSSTYIYIRSERVITLRLSFNSCTISSSAGVTFFSSESGVFDTSFYYFCSSSLFEFSRVSKFFSSVIDFFSFSEVFSSIPILLKKDFFPLVLFFVMIPTLKRELP